VGINLAVQDAVATATLLAGRLRRGAVSGADLARIRRRRLPSLLLVQALQRIMHADLAGPLVTGRQAGPAGWIMTAAQWFPVLRTLAVYLVGVGLRPERAPMSARRHVTPEDQSDGGPLTVP
jgi:2-polyprenyl-6-methoxyphenol hydroxylase-like FAD-dependent oxidoreductase